MAIILLIYGQRRNGGAEIEVKYAKNGVRLNWRH
jgi:hypothetical protein